MSCFIRRNWSEAYDQIDHRNFNEKFFIQTGAFSYYEIFNARGVLSNEQLPDGYYGNQVLRPRKKLFVSCNGLKKYRVGRSVKKIALFFW